MRRRLAVLLLLTALAPGLAAAEQASGGSGLVVHVHTLRHQPAGEAMPLVLALLSPQGTVELRPGTNTLVIRDSVASIARIVPLLRSFDHPARALEVAIWLVEGSDRVAVSPPVPGPPLPGDLLVQLRRYLPFARYDLLSAAQVRGEEGAQVSFDLPSGHAVRFAVGTVLGEERVRLNRFEVERLPGAAAGESLVRGNLNLWLGRTTVLSLANGRDDSHALMIVVRCTLATQEAQQ